MPWITVGAVLSLYPHRKLSWAYTQIRGVKDCTGRRWVNWKDWDEFGPAASQHGAGQNLPRTRPPASEG